MFHPDHITSLTDFQRNTVKYIKLIKKTKQPLLLTVRGKAAMVMSSPAEFVATMPASGKIAKSHREIRARIAAGERDLKRGRVMDWEDVKAGLMTRLDRKRKEPRKTGRKAG
jgi:PHD/YefM family antitoxin component YafN of YafNO toxin-antitoxin module